MSDRRFSEFERISMQSFVKGLNYIVTDIFGYCRYLPCGILAAVVYLIYRKLRYGKILESDPHEKRVIISRVIFIVYMSVVLTITFFNRWEGYSSTVDLSLFSRLDTSRYYFVELAENVILFIPYGLLIPLVSEKLAPFLPAMVSGFLMSLSIELAQHLTHRGYCQLDDLVTNTMGVLFGWLLYQIIHYFIVRQPDHSGNVAFTSRQQN